MTQLRPPRLDDPGQPEGGPPEISRRAWAIGLVAGALAALGSSVFTFGIAANALQRFAEWWLVFGHRIGVPLMIGAVVAFVVAIICAPYQERK